ncbi:MAG TPA: class I tRNA ligase family protein, partial [Candidatus Saccharimonadales bacterium]|nr:class I tRNA ligase family protein [Candidatus Saccharimonadales bacterium]
SDIKVRAKRQQGFNAYNPVGWDSFGLPVENYAIKVGKKPRDAHDDAKVNFKKQLKRLGYSYDWSKEISTADPSYYRWTQWIFNQLFEHGLAYQKESPQWWCETDQTVLANEQVEGGRCWRCGNPVVKKNLKQWFFKITEYADEMLEATDDLNWTEMVKTMQKNWIGKSQGAEVVFSIADRDETITVFTTRPDTLFGATFLVLAPEHPLAKTLADSNTQESVDAYIAEAARKSEIERMNESREKTGVFTGSYAINPTTGAKIPIWLADYALASYGTGALMAVPAHDERDFAFAEKFKLPIVQVIAPSVTDPANPPQEGKQDTERTVVQCIVKHPTEDKYLTLKWTEHDWHTFVTGGVEEGEELIEAAKREIQEETGYKNLSFSRMMPLKVNTNFYAAHKDVNRNIITTVLEFQLTDMERDTQKLEAHESFDVVWTDKKDLETLAPVTELSFIMDWFDGKKMLHVGEGQMINSGEFNGQRSEDVREQIVAWLEQQNVGKAKTTYKMRDWLISRQRYWGAPIPIIHCDEHGAVAVPDDQLPVVLPDIEDYKPKGGATSALAGVSEWVNTTCPTCGKPAKRETDTMDGYACSSWYFLRYIDPFNDKQAWDPEVEAHWGPVDFYNGADHAVAHLLYSRFWMRFFYKLGLVSTPEPFKRMMYNAYIMAPDGLKMSKSKGNVIDPLEIMDSGYGADSLRVYEMFIAPYDLEAPWDTRGVPGAYRFLSRAWNLTQEYIEEGESTLDKAASDEILAIAHKTVKKVTDDIENDKFNTAVSTMMEAVNTYFKLKEKYTIGKNEAWTFAVESLLQVLSPFAPHITEELWHQMGHETTIHIDTWPKWDDRYLQSDEVTIIVQVNGKLRAKLTVPKGIAEADVKEQALQESNVVKFLEGKEPRKVIYVAGRLVNIVI